MIKQIYNKDLIKKEFFYDVNEDNYYLFKTSGSEGIQKKILIKRDVFINNFKKYLKSFSFDFKKDTFLITSKISDEHPYAYGIYSIIPNLIFHENIKYKINQINESADVIFTTPSFFINFKDFLKIKKNQKIIFTGEEIPNHLKLYFNDNHITSYQSFGMTESLNIGIKDINDDFYSFIDDKISIKDNYIYSPYLCSYIIDNELREIKDKYLLTDSIKIENNKFMFLERDINVVKINEEKISLKEINDFLFSLNKIQDLIIFKTKNNGFDIINLFYVSNLNENEIKNIIIEKFKNVNYIPQNIYKVDFIPITDLGKKDLLKLRNEYKI